MKYLILLALAMTACGKTVIRTETLEASGSGGGTTSGGTTNITIINTINVPPGTVVVINNPPTPSPTPAPSPTPCPPSKKKGLSCKVYDFHGSAILTANLSTLVYLGSFTMNKVDVGSTDWSLSFPKFPASLMSLKENYLIDCSGVLVSSKKRTASLSLTADDGAVMLINNNLVIDNDGVHAAQTKTSNVSLNKGDNKIRLLWFQGPRYHIQLELKEGSNYVEELYH